MTELKTADLRDGAKNIHSIGPDRAASLLAAAADVIDALRLLGVASDPIFHGVGEERGCHIGVVGGAPDALAAVDLNIFGMQGSITVICSACEGERSEGFICDRCGDTIELAPRGDGTFRRVYHSPDEIAAMRATHGTPDEFAADL